MTIKMKDVFRGVKTPTSSGKLQFLTLSHDVTFVQFPFIAQAEYAAVVINSYDANQQEIASLKAELEQHDDEITTIEDVNQELLKIADERINGLMAMVDILQRAAKQTDNQFRIHAKLDSDTKTILSCALNKTPAQCLASVKADAKLSGAKGFKDEMLAATRAMIHPHIEGVFAVYEIKLREQGK